jgi:hypothetical protein
MWLCWSAAVCPPAAGQEEGKSGLDGIYATTELRRRLNVRTNNFEFQTVHHHYWFHPDGKVYRGLPLGGPAAFDFEQARRKSADRCGSYRLDGAQIRFRWGGAEQETAVAFARAEAGAIRIGTLRFRRLHTGGADLRLEGAFVRSNVIDFSGPAGSEAVGSVVSEHRIIFDKDGNFRESGLLAYFASAVVPSGSAANPDGVSTSTGSEKSAGAGTYRIERGTLELKYADGRSRRLLFFVFPNYAGDPRPGQIFLDGVGLLRDGK